jgi:hypothetical protein
MDDVLFFRRASYVRQDPADEGPGTHLPDYPQLDPSVNESLRERRESYNPSIGSEDTQLIVSRGRGPARVTAPPSFTLSNRRVSNPANCVPY